MASVIAISFVVGFVAGGLLIYFYYDKEQKAVVAAHEKEKWAIGIALDEFHKAIALSTNAHADFADFIKKVKADFHL